VCFGIFLILLIHVSILIDTMERAVINVRGRVQRVGFRDFVAETANGMDIGGIVRNLPDGRVEIVAEADRKALEEFIKLIRPKDDPLIKVTGVDVEFKPASGGFEYFDIKYEDFDREGFERIGTAAAYLKRIDKKQDVMIGKQDQMLDKQDETINVLGGKIDSVGDKVEGVGNKVDALREETGGNFDRLDDKYGEISKNLIRAVEGIEKMLERSEKDVERERQEFRDAIRELAEAIRNRG
jgi:acylphosphatase